MFEYSLSLLVQLYVIAVISYLIIQLSMAVANWIIQKRQESAHTQIVNDLLHQEQFPRISVVFPIYNEKADVLQSALEHAVVCLSIPGLELLFVDDGSQNYTELAPIYEHFEALYDRERLRILRSPENQGKRMALNHGFVQARGDYIITSDSDTFIFPEGVMRLVAPMIADPRLGAATGDVQVENWQDTWLTRLISLRYWVSFHVERGAQSFSGSMMCNSGAFSIYRADVINLIRQKLVSQRFLGQPCTYGDDRHLTWLVMKQGYLTRIQEGAMARTQAPRTIAEYVPQQTRWTKSFIREFFWVMAGFRHISSFSLLDTVYQPVISFCFMFALANVAFLFFETWNPFILIGELILLLIMGSLRGVYGAVRTQWAGFIRFPLYGFLHVSINLPLRWKALLTLRDTGWGTRKRKKTNTLRPFYLWQAFFFGIVLLLGALAAVAAPSDTTIRLQYLQLFDLLELTRHFTVTLLHWWFRGLLAALMLTPLFLLLGWRRLNRE
ncbi:MAG: glycosyltransferase [Chloroflexi bacterium]|nr:glycosyltransferase [Chloroflexota bacterium]